MDTRLANPLRGLQIAIGLTAALAGLDKFFNILADWGSYVSPAFASALPFSVARFAEVQSTERAASLSAARGHIVTA